MTHAEAMAEIYDFEHCLDETTETPVHVKQIKIEWSESGLLNTGDIFTKVSDFEHKIRCAAKLARNYDKTKYTVTWSDGSLAEYRTDVGDDYTHNYSFYAERKMYRTGLLNRPEYWTLYNTNEQELRETLEALIEAEAYQHQLDAA